MRNSKILMFFSAIIFFIAFSPSIAFADEGLREKISYYFNVDKANILVGIIIVFFCVAYYLYHAQKGKALYIRPIAGLSALEDAVGRATEMGKPILYIPGIMDMDDIQTLAGISILGHVAHKVAEYQSRILVPVSKSVVMTTAQEVVKEAYLKAGRPEAFNIDDVWYLTDDQFGYVAGVDGIMMRDKPAANFYMGTFYAESLILAETGYATGAIQIAGTAMASQLPFFVAACDYTLIGEELYAASAYLSQDAHQISSIKGQDMAKAVVLGCIILGCILVTLNSLVGLPDFLMSFVKFFEVK